MRTIILLASSMAKQNDFEFRFDTRHLLEALKFIVIEDPYERALIHKVLKYKHKQYEVYKNDYEKTFTDVFYCSDDVLEKLSLLKELGVALHCKEGYSPYRNDISLAYGQSDDDIIELPKIPKHPKLLLTEEALTLLMGEQKGFNRLHSIKRIKKILNRQVLNQEVAVEAVCDALVKAEHMQTTSRPKGIFFFLGPPATGKTFLAELLQEHLDAYETGHVFDMTQYTHEDSGGALYGTSRMWSNAKPGALSSFVRKHPKSIIVFDEFEKADNAVQGNLLTILSGGYLTDACGWCGDGEAWTSDRNKESGTQCNEDALETRIDFSQTLVIFTSNLGKEVYNNQELMQHLHDDPVQVESMLFDAISREEKEVKGNSVPSILPEMLSRLRQGSMVLFNKLFFKELLTIANKTLETEKRAFEHNYDISIKYEPEVVQSILLSFGPDFDIRAIKAMIGKPIFDLVTDYYMDHGTMYKKVLVKLDATAKRSLREILSQNQGIVKEFKRKNRRLQFKTKVKALTSSLQIVFTDLEVLTVKKAKDFGEDGIVLEVPEIPFSDIAGHHFVKEKLRETVGLLKDTKTLHKLGTTLSKGMLLYGPPGTGKTMLAKALASEADLPFIATTGQKLLAEGEIAKLFSSAREYAPSIIFIDEIDAIPTRGSDVYADTVVNQLLTQIDGFGTTLQEPVFVIAATNRMEKIDPALLRSGRIDIHVEVNALDYDARAYFINKMLENPMFDSKIDNKQIIKFTASLNGSDLEKVERESLLYVYKKGIKKVSHAILLEQVNTIKHGSKIENKNLQNALEATAYHEAGHAVLSKVLLPFKRIEQVTVMPRNKSLGFVSFSETTEYYSHNVDYIKNEICVSLAGRISQMKQFHTHGMDSGASSDLEHANHLAYLAISRYGMDTALVNLNVNILSNNEKHYENPQIFERMQVWLKEQSERTEALVNTHWKSIEVLAKHLIAHEQVDEQTLAQIMKQTMD